MGLIARNKGGVDFAPAPAGSHAARCVWVIDLGTQHSEKFNKDQEKILIGWELPDELIPDGDRAGEPYFVSRRYTLSLNERSALRKDLESWRGRAFTEAELDGFDLHNILDKPCVITITHNETGERTYANVTGVSGLVKGMECKPRVNPLRSFDMENPDWEVYRELPEWVQKLIDASKERKGEVKSLDEPPLTNDDDLPPDDEIPF